jgi:hypothetical protein
MHMLGHVLLQIQKKVGTWTARFGVLVLTLKTLCKTIIVHGIDRVILIAQYIKLQYVALKSNIELCLARLTKAVLLMKLGLMNVLHKVGQVGQQLLITVRQILQRVLNLLKRGS